MVDDETQQKIDVVKQRLIKYFGYNETSATDVLNYVASIFAQRRQQAGGLTDYDELHPKIRYSSSRLAGVAGVASSSG